MACQEGGCGTLGGNCFNVLAATDNTQNRGSTRATGRHGSSNLWSNWPKTGSRSAGITARAPYNIGTPKTPRTLAGTTLHHVGLGLGAHGHGIGVVKAAIGGPHNARNETAVIANTRDASGAFVITPPPAICWKCFGTWLGVGVVVLLVLAFTGR